MEKMRYLGGTGHGPNAQRLVVGNAYEVLVWFNPGAAMLNGLVRDKDGALFVAQTFNDPAEWQESAAVTRPSPSTSAPAPAKPVAASMPDAPKSDVPKVDAKPDAKAG